MENCLSRSWRRFFGASLLLCAGAASAGDLELVSRANPVLSANGTSSLADMSPGGRWTVFSSSSRTVVPGVIDRNRSDDVFLYDRTTGTSRLVSHEAASLNGTGNGSSNAYGVSDDGAWVLFGSRSGNLVAGQVKPRNGSLDVYLWERATSAVTLVSHAAASPLQSGSRDSYRALLSADGRFVVFASEADDLVAGQSDSNGGLDVFVFDRATGGIRLVSHRAGSLTAEASRESAYLLGFSADGRWITFESQAPDLVPGQVPGPPGQDGWNVLLFDQVSGTMRLVNHVRGAASTPAGSGWFTTSAMSRDGRFVLFWNSGSDLVPGQIDSASDMDLFLYDRLSETTTLVTHAPGAPLTAVGGPFAIQTSQLALSDDGRFAMLTSQATGLVPGQVDAPGTPDIFLFDLSSGTNTLVSHRAGAPAKAVGGSCYLCRISADGRWLVFSSTAPDLVSGQTGPPGVPSVFVYDRRAGTSTLVSHPEGAPARTANGASDAGPISRDGRWIAFSSAATDLGDLTAGGVDRGVFSDVFLHDRAAASDWSGRSGRSNRRVSGRAPGSPSFAAEGESAIENAGRTVSADGRYTVFTSTARNVVPGQIDFDFVSIPPDGAPQIDPSVDVFLFDRKTGKTVLVSHAKGAPLVTVSGSDPVLSADGRYVVFSSVGTNLVPGQTAADGFTNIFLFDRLTGTNRLVSHAYNAPAESVGGSFAGISADGRWIVFNGSSPRLVAGLPNRYLGQQVFLFDRTAGTIALVSHAAGSLTTPASSLGSYQRSLITDGRYVVFASDATDLVAGQIDSNQTQDLFLYDRVTRRVRLVSSRGGSATVACSSFSGLPALSADSAFVAFGSHCTDLVSGQVDSDRTWDLFLYETATGALRLVSHAAGSSLTAAGAASKPAAISANGHSVAYLSAATDLVFGAADANQAADAFLWDRLTGAAALVSHAAGAPAAAAQGAADSVALSADGRFVAYRSTATDLVAGQVDLNQAFDAFLYDRRNGSSTLISHRRGADTTAGDSVVQDLDLSAGGSCAVLESFATDLVAGDLNDTPDVFLSCRDPRSPSI